MARPPSQGPAAIAEDVQDLTRILRRVESDTWVKNARRSAADRDKLCGFLKGALNVLLVGERVGDKPARKTGS